MKNEMQMMKMDERQKLFWMMANRFTLMLVGLVWLGMIGWELYNGQRPLFLIVMVPVFALIRFGMYHFYSKRVHNFWEE